MSSTGEHIAGPTSVISAKIEKLDASDTPTLQAHNPERYIIDHVLLQQRVVPSRTRPTLHLSMAIEKRHIGEKMESNSRSSSSDEKVLDEKSIEEQTVSITSYDSKDVDEAMALVGAQRTSHFSEEYNLKLRKKLVGLLLVSGYIYSSNMT